MSILARRPKHSAQYKAHLRSPAWARIRAAALARAGYRCAFCGQDRNELRRIGRHLEVHHNSYERLGHEHPEDLTVLCAGGKGGCHAAADAQRRAANGTRQPATRPRRRKHRRRGHKRARRAFTTPLGIIALAYGGISLAGVLLPHAH
jgi:hypothetical protein